MFIVQDPSARHAVELLDVRGHHRVLDACAAPGGKTLAAADRMAMSAAGGASGSITAVDLHAERLSILKENIGRVGTGTISVARADAAREDDLRRAVGGEGFDRILVDVPCTNTGVLRRRPDARWRFTGPRMEALRKTQRALLESTSSLLLAGGRLVYSTCSLEAEENGGMIRSWLDVHPEFELVEERKTFPADDGCDGIYAALLRKRDDSMMG
jgi:16S rRNA (cytosine967-C5)-methyltransferase